MNLRKRNTTSKDKKDEVKKEILLTKHCHVLLVKLPLLENETIKLKDLRKFEKKLERHPSPISIRHQRRNAPSTQSASKIKILMKHGEKVNKTDTKTHISRETGHSKRYNKRIQFVSPDHTRSHTSKLESNSVTEFRLKDKMLAKGFRIKRTAGGAILFTSAKARHSLKCRVYLTFANFVRMFKKYLLCMYAPRTNQKKYILHALAKRNIRKEFFVKNTNGEDVLNKSLTEWIVGKFLRKEVLLKDQDELMKRAIRKAQLIVISELGKSEHEKEILRTQMALVEKNALFNRNEVSKFSYTTVVKSMDENAFRSENLCIENKAPASGFKLINYGSREIDVANELEKLSKKYFRSVSPSGELGEVSVKEINDTRESVASVTEDKTCCFAALANRACSCRSSGIRFIFGTAEKNNLSSTPSSKPGTAEKNNLSSTPSSKPGTTEKDNLSSTPSSKPGTAEKNNLSSTPSSKPGTVEKNNLSSTPSPKPDNKIGMEGLDRLLDEKCDGKLCTKCKVELITAKGVRYTFKPLDKPFDPQISLAVRILKSNHISYLRRRKRQGALGSASSS